MLKKRAMVVIAGKGPMGQSRLRMLRSAISSANVEDTLRKGMGGLFEQIDGIQMSRETNVLEITSQDGLALAYSEYLLCQTGTFHALEKNKRVHLEFPRWMQRPWDQYSWFQRLKYRMSVYKVVKGCERCSCSTGQDEWVERSFTAWVCPDCLQELENGSHWDD